MLVTQQRSLRELRESKSLSQKQLAELAGISARTILRMENGQNCATAANLQRLAVALGVSASDILLPARRQVA